MAEYDEGDFLEYCFKQMDIPVLERTGHRFVLPKGFEVEVEKKDLYKLSSEGWVISPFDDAGRLCEFIKQNLDAEV